jgi:phosphoglycolate phosphatase
MAPETILFDLDGTLVDSAATIGAVLNGMREEQGLPALPVAQYRAWVSLGAEQLIARSQEADDARIGALLAAFRSRYGQLPTPPSAVFDGAFAALDALAARRLRMGVCSNKPVALCVKVLADTGLDRYFGCVVGGGSTPHPKPHREPVDHALAMLQARPEGAVLVGDSTVDQRAARAAGIPFIFYTGGYNDGVVAGSADMEIDHLAHLPGKL